MHCGNLVVAKVRVSYIDLVVGKKKCNTSFNLSSNPIKNQQTPRTWGGGGEEIWYLELLLIVKLNQFATNKLREMQRNKKVWLIDRGEKKKWIENVPKEAQALHLLDKDFKLIIINMFKQLKESFPPWITNKTPFIFSIILEFLARVTRQVKEKASELKRKKWNDLY